MQDDQGGGRAAGYRVAIILPIALLAMLSFVWGAACSSSSSGSSAIIGEWQEYSSDGGAGSVSLYFFFNADGTVGAVIPNETVDGIAVGGECVTANYTLNGSTLTIDSPDGGIETSTYTVTFSGNSITLDSPDGGAPLLFTRVNSNSATTCSAALSGGSSSG